MNPNEVMRIVDAIHRDKNIDQEVVFQAIESAYATALRKYYGEEADVQINIDRQKGYITGTVNGEPREDIAETIGRIGAQTAKQVIIQKIREAERDALYGEYDDMLGQMVSGVVQRNEGGAATVALGNVEAMLPRSEQIPGETHHANERVRAVVCEVRKQGSRVKVILSRTRPAPRAAAVRAGNSRNRRRSDHDRRDGPRAGLPQQSGRQQHRSADRLRRCVRRRARQSHQEHRR